eukprot:GFUD01008648.1.p1 GENE.GFUD01008648.1~~GFUD01008648.1.p1  ORF type:complete len:181 (-),score=56.31 GFUD01008648.1:198-740(-)
MKGNFIVIFLASVAVSASVPLSSYSYQPVAGQSPDYGPEDSDYSSLDSLGLADQLAEKRGGGRWKMRMFKRDPGEDLEADSDSNHEIPEDYADDGIEMSKRGRPWKMRMFKKKDPWKMRMFKKEDPWKMRMFKKGEPWKMRMFKRLAIERTFGKRPDKWQMRMFKRDPEMRQETPGDRLR